MICSRPKESCLKPAIFLIGHGKETSIEIMKVRFEYESGIKNDHARKHQDCPDKHYEDTWVSAKFIHTFACMHAPHTLSHTVF